MNLACSDFRALLKQYTSFCNGSPLVSFGDISRALIAELWAQQQWGQVSEARRFAPCHLAADSVPKALSAD